MSNIVKEDPINTFAADTYKTIIRDATEDLLKFLSSIESNPLCAMYFDEALELGDNYWVLLRLVHNQDSQKRMWYIFMGTKSQISYYAPTPSASQLLLYSCSPDLFKK
jgi:hypothetical protein